MNDAEIIKALECCTHDGSACRECCFDKENECIEALSRNALDLINRQKAEIERLHTLIKEADEYLSNGEFVKGLAIIINLAKEMVGECK